METLTFRPKPDRRTQPRIAPTDIADRAFELYRRVEGHHVSDRRRGFAVTGADAVRKSVERDAGQDEG